MADIRALTLQGGRYKQHKDADNLLVGSGIKSTNSQPLLLSGASGVVNLAAGDDLVALAGDGVIDFSLATGIFKTSTGAVTVGPGAVTVSGVTTFSASGTALSVTNDLVVGGNLTVSGTTFTTEAETVQIADNFMHLNSGYVAGAAQTAGLVATIDPDATATEAIAVGGFTAGVAATSNPEVEMASTAGFAAGDIVQITGSTSNDGLYEVHSLETVPTRLELKGIGTDATTLDFVENQVTTEAGAGQIDKVSVTVLRAKTGGGLETASGATNALSFSDLATGAGNSLQAAYDQGNSITLDASGDFLVSGSGSGSFAIGETAATITQTGTGQVSFSGNVNATSGLDVTGAGFTHASGGTGNVDVSWDFSGGLVNSAGELLVSGGNVQLNDNIVLSLGTGNDLLLSHDGTNSAISTITGDLLIDGVAASAVRFNSVTPASDIDFFVEGVSTDRLFHVDAANNRIIVMDVDGVSTAIPPFAQLHVHTEGTGSNKGVIATAASTANNDGGVLAMGRSRGTTASPTPVTTGDLIGNLIYKAQSTTSVGGVNWSGQIQAIATELHSAAQAGTRLDFLTMTEGAITTQKVSLLNGDWLPGVTAVQDLGSASLEWGNLFLNDAARFADSADPTAVANTGFVYVKSDGGDSELFYRDDGGNIVQITKDGALNAGDSTGTVISATAEVTLSAGNLVSFDNGATGEAFKADHSAEAEVANAVGFAQTAITAAAAGDIQISGEITIVDALWDAAPVAADIGKIVYGSITTAGEVTITPPSGTGEVSQKVGIITFADGSANTTRIAIQVGDAITLA